MTIKISLICLLLFFTHLCFGHQIVREFSSDYCTFLNVKNPQIKKCCYTHDLYYWAGGSTQDRRQVDLDFKNCIKDHDKEFLAFIMYSGVKVGSLSPWKFKGKQWGNAWGDKVHKERLEFNEIEDLHQSLILQGALSALEIETFINNLKKRDKILE